MDWRNIPRWLYPGLNIKRWILVMVAGVICIGLGAAYILLELYRTLTLPPLFQYLTF